MKMLSKGQEVPEFRAIDQDGKPFTQENLIGQKTILFFYPADMTPTCTVEACNIRDNHRMFLDLGYKVYGVSPDNQLKHQKFITKHHLTYPLISDPELSMIKAFGVWGPKTTFGKSYDGLLRTTFILDEKGLVQHVIYPVKSKMHAEQIMSLIS